MICVVDVKCGSVRNCSGDEATTGDLSWAKWSYWLLHSLLFLSVYTAILVLPHTRWRVSNVQPMPPCLAHACCDSSWFDRGPTLKFVAQELLPAKASFFRYIGAQSCPIDADEL